MQLQLNNAVLLRLVRTAVSCMGVRRGFPECRERGYRRKRFGRWFNLIAAIINFELVLSSLFSQEV